MFDNVQIVHSVYFQVPINLTSSDIQFGFWYVGDYGHSHGLSRKHPEELPPINSKRK